MGKTYNAIDSKRKSGITRSLHWQHIATLTRLLNNQQRATITSKSAMLVPISGLHRRLIPDRKGKDRSRHQRPF